MRYPGIFFLLLSIFLIDLAFAESKPKKQIVERTEIVDSANVTVRDTIENTTLIETVVNGTESTPIQETNDIHRGGSYGKRKYDGVSKKKPKIIRGIDDDQNYVKGYFDGYYYIGNGDTTNYFVHGRYQRPSTNYYGNYNHKLEDKSTLGYYLGFGMKKMDHNEYFRHNNYSSFKVHHYFFKNSTMLPEQYVGADNLLHCAHNTSVFCPESTEAICLRNTTVWCASKLSFVQPCEVGNAVECVTTRLPCVRNDLPHCHKMVETVRLPCIAKIKILDPYEDKNGLTLISVAGTFVLSPVSSMSDRTYCVTIVAEPSRD